jgi:hypothetical protein
MHENISQPDFAQPKRRATDDSSIQLYNLKFVAFPVVNSADSGQAEKDIQSLLTPATLVENLRARFKHLYARRTAPLEIEQQQEALSTWEDEGGSAIKPLSIRRVSSR